MKVFIAGSQGMVGSALARLAPKDIEVVTATKLELDLSKPQAVFDFLSRHNPQSIVLAAARVGGIGTNSVNHKNFLLDNLNIQNSVIEAASNLKIPNFLFLGSSCVYPKLTPQPIREDSLLSGPLEATNEGYALAKIAGIRLCKAIYDQEGLNYFSLMPTNLYGPNDNFNTFTSHVPAALMRKFHEAKIQHLSEVVVWGSGSPRREFMHVDDMAQACWYMLDQDVGGKLINIGTEEEVIIAQFAELMAKVVGYEGEIIFDESKPDGTPRKLLDVSKAHAYGWKHQIELEDGLRKTYAWFLDALGKGEVRGY